MKDYIIIIYTLTNIIGKHDWTVLRALEDKPNCNCKCAVCKVTKAWKKSNLFWAVIFIADIKGVMASEKNNKYTLTYQLIFFLSNQKIL